MLTVCSMPDGGHHLAAPNAPQLPAGTVSPMADILNSDEFADDPLSPTEWLVMEVLAARFRLGENSWPFPNRLRPTLRRLAGRHLISWKSGVVQGTAQAWLTRDGRELWIPDTAESDGR